MKLIITLFSFIILSSFSFATHILGLDLEYRHLGNDDFVIELSLRSDCNPGTVYIDDSIMLETLTSSGSYALGDIWLYEDTVIQLSTYDNTDTCNYNYNQCIKITKFIDTITIPSSFDGIYIAHTLCCRSGAILNVANPSTHETTVYSFIPPVDQMINSSPQWNTYSKPNLIVDTNEELDFSATDPDGDSLVYSLYTPLKYSGDIIFSYDNQAVPPENLVLDMVNYENGFTNTRPFNSSLFTSDSMSLDSETGILTGIPHELGVYNLAVRCEEYRNGVKINQIHRDFAIDVIDSYKTEYSFEQVCNTNEVIFYNTSIIPGDSCVWDFGDGSPQLEIPVDDTVNHFFPSVDSTYSVQLITSQGTACADTLEQSVLVDSIFATLNIVDTACFLDTILLDINYSGNSNFNDVTWSIGQNINFSTTGDTSVLLNPGLHQIAIEASNNQGCIINDQDSIFIMDYPQVDIQFVLDSSTVMDTLYLDLDTAYTESFEWSTSTGGTFLGGVTDAPVYYVLSNAELQDSLLGLAIIGENSYCPASVDSIIFTFNNNFIISVNKLLGFDVSFTNTVQSQEPITDWYWDFGDDSNTNIPNPTHTYTNPGIYTVTLHAYNDKENYVTKKDIILDDASLENHASESPFTVSNQSDQIFIQSKTSKTNHLMISNALGQVVKHQKFQNTAQINKNKLSTGVYRLILVDDGQNVFVQSFTIR